MISSTVATSRVKLIQRGWLHGRKWQIHHRSQGNHAGDHNSQAIASGQRGICDEHDTWMCRIPSTWLQPWSRLSSMASWCGRASRPPCRPVIPKGLTLWHWRAYDATCRKARMEVTGVRMLVGLHCVTSAFRRCAWQWMRQICTLDNQFAWLPWCRTLDSASSRVNVCTTTLCTHELQNSAHYLISTIVHDSMYKLL